MNPKISVILTTHDAYEKYLERAIQSVLDQTFKDFELIVVKDGGTNSQDLADHFNNQRIYPFVNYIHLEKNFGQHTRPKNQGTLAARGEYIAYLDADNMYRKDHLQALYREVLKSGVDVVYGDRMITNEKNGKKVPGVKADFNLSLLAQQNFIDTSDVLAKKSSIDAVGGWDEEPQYFADWNLWVRMAKNGSTFKHVPLMITDYTYHGENNVLKSKEGMNFDVQGCYIWPKMTSYGERDKLSVAVFTMTKDRLSCTQETFISMRAMTKYPFDHFVLDQGSTDKTPIWLADVADKMNIQYDLLEKNVGISAGSNMLLDMIKNPEQWNEKNHSERRTVEGKYDIIIKLDNDAEFLTEGWLEAIVDVFERSKGLIVSPYVEGLIDNPGGAPRVRDGYIGNHYVGVTKHVGGICVAADAKVYDTFRWDEHDFLHGQQDVVFSQEMRKRGLCPIYLENVRIEHIFNTSFSSTGEGLEKEGEREYRDLRRKEKTTRYSEE